MPYFLVYYSKVNANQYQLMCNIHGILLSNLFHSDTIMADDTDLWTNSLGAQEIWLKNMDFFATT